MIYWQQASDLGYLPAFWHVSDNFGDALSPFLAHSISGLEVRFVDYRIDGAPLTHMVTGSLLHPGLDNVTIWGTGCAFERDVDPDGLAPPSDRLFVAATRGHLTKNAFRKAGHPDCKIGDPGFLLPQFLPRAIKPVHEVGIICSWIDYDQVVRDFGNEVPVISSLGKIDAIVDQLCACEHVVAGCLHGLVAAAAYGRPTCWARFSDNMVGDGFKFRDVLSTLSVTSYDPVDFARPVPVRDLVKSTFRHELDFDTEALLLACPFRAPSTLPS